MINSGVGLKGVMDYYKLLENVELQLVEDNRTKNEKEDVKDK